MRRRPGRVQRLWPGTALTFLRSGSSPSAGWPGPDARQHHQHHQHLPAEQRHDHDWRRGQRHPVAAAGHHHRPARSRRPGTALPGAWTPARPGHRAVIRRWAPAPAPAPAGISRKPPLQPHRLGGRGRCVRRYWTVFDEDYVLGMPAEHVSVSRAAFKLVDLCRSGNALRCSRKSSASEERSRRSAAPGGHHPRRFRLAVGTAVKEQP